MCVCAKLLSYVRFFVTPWTIAHWLCPWNFPGKNTRLGCHFLFQGIFLTQGSNLYLLCLLHWQADSLPLGHLGSRMYILCVCIHTHTHTHTHTCAYINFILFILYNIYNNMVYIYKFCTYKIYLLIAFEYTHTHTHTHTRTYMPHCCTSVFLIASYFIYVFRRS